MIDLDALTVRLAAALERGGDMLATAESCTGGGIAHAATTRAGSSGWFDRGYVTYSDGAKQDMLGVPGSLLEAHGAVSEPVVSAMAQGALRGKATVAVAVSGIAGPGGATATKPVGTVCIGWAKRGGSAHAVTRRYAGDRSAVREQAVAEALEGVIELLGSD